MNCWTARSSTLTEAQILIERWRREYNTVRTQERPRQRHLEDDRKKEDRSQEAVTAGQSRRHCQLNESGPE